MNFLFLYFKVNAEIAMRRKARLERESQEEAIRIQVVFHLSLENKFSMKVKNFVCELRVASQ